MMIMMMMMMMILCCRGEMTGEGMWLDSQHGEMIQGSFNNGTVTGGAVWERGDGVRFEGVFRRGHAHGPGLVTWYDDGYRWDLLIS